MIILFDFVLSIVAAWLGLNFGACFWAYWIGSRWLSRTLADDKALADFWNRYYGPLGGVASALRLERDDWRPVSSQLYELVVSGEAGRLKGNARTALVSMTVVAILSCILSNYTSWWVTISFVLAFALSILFRHRLREQPNTHAYATQCLVDLYRPVRLWMEADRKALNGLAVRLRIDGIVRVIDAMEPVRQSQLLAPGFEAGGVCIERIAEMARAWGMSGYNFNSRSNLVIGQDIQRFDVILQTRRMRSNEHASTRDRRAA